tara:strand:+ start:17 stop:1111 length:1095 start_codon:yes stop_codon:yes gene_type:complete
MSVKLARSPYIIQIDETDQTETKVKLYLSNTSSFTTDPQYTLSKKIPSSNITATYYNIAPYVREYFTFGAYDYDTANFFDTATSSNFVVNYKVEKFKTVGGTESSAGTETGQFVNGYSEYMEGQNRAHENVLLDEGTYLYHYDSSFSTTQRNALAGSFDAELDVGEKIRYTNLSTGATHEITISVAGVKVFGRVYTGNLADGNKVEMINTSSNVVWTATFKPECEPKYSPIVVDFVNKYGSWSRMFFFKVNQKTITVKSNEYKNNPQSLPYSATGDGGQIRQFNRTGNESIKLNSGFVNDGYAEYIQQLMLSEHVTVLDYDRNTNAFPAKVKTQSLVKQTGLNDGTMNYTLDFDFAFDLINNVT